MLNLFQLKFLEMVNLTLDYLEGHEGGQTSAEYVAITAVGVALAIAVLWVALSGPLSDAVSTIGGQMNSWVTGSIS